VSVVRVLGEVTCMDGFGERVNEGGFEFPTEEGLFVVSFLSTFVL
jgi:hypothetical protein